MFELHIQEFYSFLTKQKLDKSFSVIQSDRNTKILYDFNDTKWILVPNKCKTIREEDISTNYTKTNPDRIFFIKSTDFEFIENKGLCRRLSNEDKLLFDEFKSSCSEEDKEEGMVSLDDPTVYGCFVDNKIVSVSSLWNWGDKLSDVGILTHPLYRNKGYGKSVCQTLMSENDRLYIWRCDFDNKGSDKLAKSIGFTQAGVNYTLKRN